MTDQEIYQKIEESYNSEKGKNFITHLLRSFLPVNRSSRMFDNDRKLRLVDCITGEKLCDLNYHLGLMAGEEGMSAMMDNMKAQVSAELDGKTTYEVPESVKKLRKHVKPLAITCEKSDKVMSEQTLGQLFNFYATQMLSGNKHLNWVAKNERGKEFIKHGKNNGFIQNKRQERTVKKAVEGAKMSLGDLDVLKDLKAKMENGD